ncbi:hypothetical protein GCM10010309_72390 [Streptomyces violaceochromogenes]|nr:hypothetical protein GCM10010309_72390 [Streptomyces violaceochromogenes]
MALSLVALSNLGDEPDGDDVYGLLKKYVAALAPGSHLILSQVTPDLNPDAIGKAAEHFRRSGTPFHPRSLAEFARFFEGLELLGPGLIPVSGWRPDPQDVACRRRASCRCTRVWPARPDSRRSPDRARSTGPYLRHVATHVPMSEFAQSRRGLTTQRGADAHS